MNGFEICPRWLLNVYRKSVNYTCQLCNKAEREVGKLTPHRIKRRHEGGLYTIAKLNSKENNVKVVCNSCHKKIHSGEFNKR